MEKKILLVTPIMAILLLTNCNKANVDPNQVNEQEMINALTMKDIDYLQVRIQQESELPSEGALHLFYPSCYQRIDKNDTRYYEYFVIKDTDNYKKYERYNEQLDFIEVHGEEADYHSISDFVNDTLSLIKDKKYTDFTYDKENKEYLINYIEEGKNEHSALKFQDKKLISFDSWFDSESRDKGYHHTLTYNQMEPPNPPEVILTKPTKIVTTIGNNKIETNLTYNEHLWPTITEEYEYEGSELIRHSITEETYDEYDNPITYLFVEDEIEISSYTTTYLYTPSHKIKEQCSKGVKDKTLFNDKYIFTYDEYDRETSHEYFTVNSIDDEPLPSSKYEYSYLDNYQEYISMKYLVYKIDKYEVDTTTIQELDKKGRVITTTEYNGEYNQEDYQRQTTNEYDDYDCKKKVTIITPNDVYLYREISTYLYHKNNPSKPLNAYTVGYDKSSSQIYQSNLIYDYDNKDRLIKTVYEENPVHIVTEYFYD